MRFDVGQKFRTQKYVGTILSVNETVIAFRESRPSSTRLARRAVFEHGVREGLIQMIDPVESFDLELDVL